MKQFDIYLGSRHVGRIVAKSKKEALAKAPKMFHHLKAGDQYYERGGLGRVGPWPGEWNVKEVK